MAYKNFRTIDDLSLKGKKVLLRIDINSEIKNGKPVISERIIKHSKTVSQLKKKGAKVIVIAHQSRPGKNDFLSLKNHAKLMNKYVKIFFVNSVVGDKVNMEIEKMNNGDAILLENIRMQDEEFNISRNNKIIKFFREKVDFYVNDAFSVCHRNETSITLMPRYFKSAIGPVLREELNNIDRVRTNISKSLFILGGNKVDDIVLLIRRNKILPTGILSFIVLKAAGYDLGKTEDRVLKKEYKFLKLIKKNMKLFTIPEDLAYVVNKKRKDVKKEDFPVNSLALDIGKETTKKYIKEINSVKFIFWKGTAGDTSINEFSYGTRELLKAIEKSKAYCVTSGGHSETAIRKYKINKNKFGYISLSGGALIHYISGEKLPGLMALKRRRIDGEKI